MQNWLEINSYIVINVLGLILTTNKIPTNVSPGSCPNGKMPLGDTTPVLCGNQTDSIGCPIGYYCRNGPPDVCCPDNEENESMGI